MGAGLDTFAFRYPDLLKSLNVFELDHPATQSFKRQRVDKVGWGHPENLHYISIDFTREDIVNKLNSSLNYSALSKSFLAGKELQCIYPKRSI